MLACLGTDLLSAELPASWNWLRSWSRRFLARVCQTRDPAPPAPPEPECSAFAATAPLFAGAEFVNADILTRWWAELAIQVRSQVIAHPGGLESWLREANPLWHLGGRVTFHLAENKTDSQRPCAFRPNI